MKRTKIAPTLRELLDTRTDPYWNPARAEFRALLAHVRATRRMLDRGNYRMPYPEWSALVDADARLRRLSAPERDAGKRAGARPGARRTRT